MARGVRAGLWCCILALLSAQSGAFAIAPIARIRQRMLDSLGNTPDFVCSIAVEQTARMGPGDPINLPPATVEAGVINGKELYAWPAADEARNRLREVLGVFARAGTGVFALYSRALFFTVDATYYGVPDDSKDSRRLSRLDFAMPREVSTYSPSKDGKPVLTAYGGAIWVDPETMDIVRLSLQSGEMPADLGIKAVSQAFEFSRVKLAENMVLLPVSTTLTLQELSGRELRIAAKFGDCRPYQP